MKICCCKTCMYFYVYFIKTIPWIGFSGKFGWKRFLWHTWQNIDDRKWNRYF